MSRDLWRTDLDVNTWMDKFTAMFEAFRKTYVDPDTGLVYDSPYDPEAISRADREIGGFRQTAPDAFELPADYARPDLGAWPTPEEVAAAAPCVNGWFTPIENAASRGSMLMAGLARGAFALDEERRREDIRLLFRGLVSLWEVPGRTGFVCRGFLPKSRAFYRQTSHDQVPLYLIGLAAYHDSPFCTSEDRDQVREIFTSVMHWLEDGGWATRLYDDDSPTPHSGGDSDDPGVNAKTMALMLVAHRITRDPHWRKVYLAWRDKDGRRRLGYMARRDKTWQIFDPWQIGLMFRILADHDDDPECRAFYNEQRWLFLHTLAYSCHYPLPPATPPAAEAPSPRRLPDWRPALARMVRESGFKPNDGVFWYQVGACLREMSPEPLPQDPLATFNAGLIGAHAYILGAYRQIMADWPHGQRAIWGAERIRERLEEVFARIDPRRPPENMHVLAFALGE